MSFSTVSISSMCFGTVSLQYAFKYNLSLDCTLLLVSCKVSLQYAFKYSFSPVCVSVQFLSSMRFSTVSLQYAFKYNLSLDCTLLLVSCKVSLQYAFKYSFSPVCVSVQFLSSMRLSTIYL